MALQLAITIQIVSIPTVPQGVDPFLLWSMNRSQLKSCIKFIVLDQLYSASLTHYISYVRMLSSEGLLFAK